MQTIFRDFENTAEQSIEGKREVRIVYEFQDGMIMSF